MAESEQTFVCSEEGCLVKFSRKSRLIVHMRTHTGERPYVCDHEGCDKSYARSQHLKRHKKTHEETAFACVREGCDKCFTTEERLQNHISRQHSVKKSKPYKCSYCHLSFNKRNLKICHESKHTNRHPYACPKEGCDANFPTPTKLRRHVYAHSGHKCKKCDAGGFTWSLLRKHMAVAHMKDRQCDVCSRVFAKVYNLKKHMTIHLDPSERHRCPVGTCPRAYTEEKNLRYHIEMYHSQRPFQCSEPNCGQAFKEEVELQKHRKKHDPNVPLPSKKRRKKKEKDFAAYLAGCIEPSSKKQKLVDQMSEMISTPQEELNMPPEESGESNIAQDLNSKEVPSLTSIIRSKLCNTTYEVITTSSVSHKLNCSSDSKTLQLVSEICS